MLFFGGIILLIERTTNYWLGSFYSWLNEGTLCQFLPEVAALIGVPQPKEFHSEGDVFSHILIAIKLLDIDADVRLFWSVLLHDIGKAQTTKFHDGRWRSNMHHQVGADAAIPVLARFGLAEISEDVSWLIKHHHFALGWGDVSRQGLTTRQQKFCKHRLFPLLVELCRIDAHASLGNSKKGDLLETILKFIER